MKALIIEDEQPAARRLKKLIAQVEPDWEILEVIDTIEDSVAWLNNFEAPDVIFMDIELADGQSFAIFNKVEIQSPIVFTTAYDQFALKAFQVNGLDYLLKPIEIADLQRATQKVRKFSQSSENPDYSSLVQLLREKEAQPEYKERFMVRVGDQLKFVPVAEVAYFFSEEGNTSLVCNNGKELVVDFTLDQLSEILDPAHFFRVNRKSLLKISSINKIHTWFNSRLKIELLPNPDFEVVVSRDRVSEFKNWLDR